MWLLGACTAGSPATMEPIQSMPTTPSTETATAIPADVILTEAQHQILTIVKVGQIINVAPLPEHEWTVNYRDLILQVLTPPEKIKQPGAGGWFFRVIAPGSTEIVFESIPQPCPGGTPSPPAIIRFVFPIQAEK